ncbi:MAG: glycosyltransferase family 1 protein [Rhodothermales bacterium]
MRTVLAPSVVSSFRMPDAQIPPVRPVRVALFTGNYNHIADGVSLTLNRLVRHLEAQGHVVRVVGPTIEEPPIDHAGTLLDVPSLPMPGRPEYRISTILPRRVKAELEAFAPDVVHIATPDFLGLQALRWAKQQKLPIVASYHTHFSSYLKYYNRAWMESAMWGFLRWFYRQCTQIYVPTPSMAEVLREHGIDRGLLLWPRGVETDRFTPSRRNAAWRAEQGFAEDDVVVTFVSRLVWEKGLEVFAQVIERLEADGVPHRSLIVGEGVAREPLEARLPKTVFTGYLGGTDIATAYASSDVFFFPSDTETFGNVTLEAMASGTPPVCADATGAADLVDHGVDGFLAPPEDVDTFYQHVRRLVTDADLRRQFGETAHERAQAYDWPVILGRIPAYYATLLHDEPLPPGASPFAAPALNLNLN